MENDHVYLKIWKSQYHIDDLKKLKPVKLEIKDKKRVGCPVL